MNFSIVVCIICMMMSSSMLVGINALSISLTYANINRHHHRHNILLHHGHGCTAAPYHQQHYSTSNNCIANLISIPRGGGLKLFRTNSEKTAVVASTSSGILSDITSKLATVTSTPSGAFNTALVLLGATTAILKLYNKVENDGDGKNGEEVVVSSHLNFCCFFDLL